jgi:uncharacterized protein (TIGR02145 family)
MKKSFSLVLLLSEVFCFNGCEKSEPTIPVLATTAPTNITATTALSGGLIISDGGAAITARGICWGIMVNPTTSDTKTTDGDGTGQFVSNINGIEAGTLYHVRAYATNSVGTAYGADYSFSTLGQVPSATTLAATDITSTGSTLNGTVNANYASTTVTFEYGLTTSYGSIASGSSSPVTGNTVTTVNAVVSSLTPGTTYHFRIKAVNSLGTEYGSDMSFSTLLTDIDGNVYNTVQIGTQVWMRENLKTTKYNDGTPIPNATDIITWASLATGGYCWYNFDTETYRDTYGALYNWHVVSPANSKNVCPAGWHVPADNEWTTLINYLGGENVAGDKLKETGSDHWAFDNIGASNESGFTALPGGILINDGLWIFFNINYEGYWWSSTEHSTTYAWYCGMAYDGSYVSRNTLEKLDGLSVRCVRDL